MRKLTTLVLFLGIALGWNSAFPAEMQDYSKIWKAWGKRGQTAYIGGFIDGGGYAMRTVLDEIFASDKQGSKVPKGFYENIRVKTATLYDQSKIIDIITNLYKEPANSYIWIQEMVYIARDSLSGKDVTTAILEARRSAIINHKLNGAPRPKPVLPP